MSDINIQELDKSKIYFVMVPDDYEKAEIQDILEKFNEKGIECLIARKGFIVSKYKGFPEITLPEGSSELEEKLAGAERTRDNLIQLGFPTFQSCKEYADKMNYAKTIIKDLLDNSDEYARQRAEQFLKENK